MIWFARIRMFLSALYYTWDPGKVPFQDYRLNASQYQYTYQDRYTSLQQNQAIQDNFLVYVHAMQRDVPVIAPMLHLYFLHSEKAIYSNAPRVLFYLDQQ